MLTLEKDSSLFIILLAGSLATLVITPFLSLDPINLPKMLIVVTGASLLFPALILESRRLFTTNISIFLTSFLFVLFFTFALVTNQAPWAEQLWGTWGRSTGYLTYLAFLVFMLAVLNRSTKSEVKSFRTVFERVSYLITGYALIQAGDLDPIEWSQKAMVATLGNINFMSSFLGLASISFLSRFLEGKLLFTAKLHYSFFMLLNVYLIWSSKSIQGLGIFLAGACFIFAMVIRLNLGLKRSIYWLSFVTPVGFITFLGTAGLGPLSSIRQETVIFRFDYWLAGINMTRSNLLNGVGIDSYGDYYQQYRDIEAVVRTGPQRVTNTAHNVFLDISSGAGIFSGICFSLIFLLTLRVVLNFLRTGRFDNTDLATSGIFVGFFVFSLISINQIGVAVWGFIFIGYLHGANARHNSEISKLDRTAQKADLRDKTRKSRMTATLVLLTTASGIAGLVLSLLPNITDAQMLKTVKDKNYDKMLDIASKSSALTAHKERYLNLVLQEGKEEEAYEFALNVFKANPRNELALRIIGSSELAPKQLRFESLNLLLSHDPNNLELRQVVRNLLKSI